MPYLVAAVVIVGALCAVDLVLTFGVIRRLREHTALLSENRSGGGSSRPELMLGKGSKVADFTAVTTDGAMITRSDLATPTLVSFMSPRCAPCKENLPAFVRSAAGMAGGRRSVLAVIAANDDDDLQDMLTELSAVARVIVEKPDGEVADAFGVRGYPAFGLIDGDGVVLDSGFPASRVPELAMA